MSCGTSLMPQIRTNIKTDLYNAVDTASHCPKIALFLIGSHTMPVVTNAQQLQS